MTESFEETPIAKKLSPENVEVGMKVILVLNNEKPSIEGFVRMVGDGKIMTTENAHSNIISDSKITENSDIHEVLLG